ncbi:MAG: hypothetical protein HOV66_27870 [Streptomycetaceae bacterium]|nr:hypothetical protein [Streptomycetaceae bacterium]
MTAPAPVDPRLADLDARLVLAGAILANARRAHERSPNSDRAADLEEAWGDVDTLLDLRAKLTPRRES